jgi:galactose oxidase
MKLAPTRWRERAGFASPPTLAMAATVAVVLLIGGCGGGSDGNGTKNTVEPPPPPPELPPAPAAFAPPGPGSWSPPITWPHIAIHLAVLPDGRVVSWGGGETVGQMDHAAPDVWTPSTGAHVRSPELDVNIFCSGHAFTADGALFVSGGHIADYEGTRTTRIYTSETDSWSKSGDMTAGRWYPTNTTLPDGSILALAGSDEQQANVTIPEIWQNGVWRRLTGAPLEMEYYPRAFVTPDGRVVSVAPEVRTQFLSVQGAGSWTAGPQTILGRERDYGSAVLLDGKVLLAGGADPPTNTAETLDLHAGTSAAWVATGSMEFARRQMNLTILADGRVLATGGTSSPGFNDARGALLSTEIWDPETGRWTTVANAAVPRLYHSTAALLPDGRVISAGGGRPPAENGGTNHLDAEIYSPSYLFDANGAPAVRPTIGLAPSTVGYGERFVVQSPDAASISKITLIRLAAVTHAFDQNTRLVTLPFMRVGESLRVRAPANANLAPPGHYMMFLVNSKGVPSVAEVVRVR